MLKRMVRRHPRILRNVRVARDRARRSAIGQFLQVRGVTEWTPLVPADDFIASMTNAISTLSVAGYHFGDYLEFGVSRGTSMACMHEALKHSRHRDVRLIGFDSFEGLPSGAGEVEGWSPGAFHSTLGATRRYLSSSGVDLTDVHLVKGWFRDTCTAETVDRLAIERASVVMFDCDLYSASVQAIEFCRPLLAERSVLIFDDWGWRSDMEAIGQREAFEEFLAKHSEFSVQPLPAYRPEARVFLVTKSEQDGPTRSTGRSSPA